MMPHLLTDSNYGEFIRPEYQTLPSRVPVGCLPCASRVYADEVPLIPEEEWSERIDEMTAKKLWPQDIYERYNPVHQNQNGMNFCWAFSLAQAVEIKRAIQHLPYVQLGPESLGGDVNWRNAGNYLDSALAWAIKYGIAPRSMVPEHSRTPSRYDPAWETERAKYKPDEYWDGNRGDYEHRFAQAVTMLLTGDCAPYVGMLTMPHAVVFTKLVKQRGEICAYTPNSHDKDSDWVLSGRSKLPQNLYGPRTINMGSTA